MNNSMLSDEAPNVRTQISLTRSIKRAIEAKGRLLGESLSEYLRKAAMIRLLSESEEDKELELAAKNFIGQGKWNKIHPAWKSKPEVRKWLKKLRSEW